MSSGELPIVWEHPPDHQAVLDIFQVLLELYWSLDASRVLPGAPQLSLTDLGGRCLQNEVESSNWWSTESPMHLQLILQICDEWRVQKCDKTKLPSSMFSKQHHDLKLSIPYRAFRDMVLSSAVIRDKWKQFAESWPTCLGINFLIFYVIKVK